MPDETPNGRLSEPLTGGPGSLALLSSVLDNMPVGVALLVPIEDGLDFEYVYSNPIHQALKAGDTIVGKTYGEVWPELADFALPHLREVYETGVPWGAHDAPLRVEIEPGVLETRYYTFELTKIVVDDLTVLLDRALETTEEVEALRTLRQSEERFRSVLENSLDAAYRRNLKTDTYDYLSPVIESIAGFTPEEFAGLPLEDVLDRIHPDDMSAVQEALDTATETGQLTAEYRFRAKDGRYVWIADNAVVVRDADGSPLYRSGVVRDITSRKRLEEKAESEHQRLRALMDTLPVAVFISDAGGGLIYTNKQVAEIWGQPPETPSVDEYGLYKAWRPMTGERLKADDWSGARALAGAATIGERLEIERFDGRRSTILNSSVPIRDERGEITGQLTVEQDISELVRAEEQLQEAHAALKRSEEQWSLAVEHFTEGAIIATEDEQVIYWNPAAREMHGFTTPEEGIEPLERTPITFDLLTPEDARLLALDEWPMKRIKRGERVRDLELRLRRPDQGWEKIVSYSGSMVDTADGERLIFLSVHDLTEQRRVEAQLREAARYSQALNEIDADVTSTLDTKRIMDRVVERAAKAVGADLGAVFVPVDGRWRAEHTWRVPSWLDGCLVEKHELPFSAEAVREGRAVLYTEPEQHPRWEGSIAQRLGVGQVLDAPLTLGSGEAGDFGLYKFDGAYFTEEDRSFLQKVGVAVSLALQNALQYERERSVADTLQGALLTLPEAIPGIEFAHAYHSAAEAARVGGDFYDIFRISSESIGIVVGDVAGKGLEASVLTSLAKYTIRAHAMGKGANPAKVLELTNEAVLQETQGESFVTVFFGVLDLADGGLVYASGGHTTTVIVAPDGELTELPSTGPVVGAFTGVRFDLSHTHVGIDASVFLYTDGLTEARHGEEFFGDERLLELLGELKGVEPAQTVRAVVDEILRFTGGLLKDDLAILNLGRLGDTAEAPRATHVDV